MRLEYLLRGKDYVNIERLSQLLNISKRQVYRYLGELKKQVTDKVENEGNAYRISEKNDGAMIKSKEELLALYEAIQNNSLNNDQSKRLLKIITQSNCMWEDEKPEEEKKNQKIISTIQRAIDNKTKFLINGYKSRDKDLSDRMVTPVLLDKLNRRVYGLEKGQRKCFNFENVMVGVQLTRVKAEVYKEYDPFEGADPFGFMKPSDNRPPINVQVALNTFAHSQLIRQFPSIRIYISQDTAKEYPFVLSISVWDIQPIARFCVGLLHSVKILGSEDAIRQIKGYADEKVIGIGFKNNF